ncbi:uncharacterized protein N7484_005828 [Penicillium longicatenatum]|uniref:uncharacterized protein n=1 Tax=Penicillium longicatenatum TaxID=1561947 RepID=UPI0025474C09|nr:uncharacterized protein N7484_005828 [Penicillium longicatenatum]KAJ5643321.1 hypothetical protein N7484_005828 [Penicillium longicatenatum]
MTDPTTSTQPQDPSLNSEDPALTPDQRQKEALAAFTATLHSVGTNLEAPLRERATIINGNALSLERQEAELAGHSAALAKQNDGWEKIADDTRAGLKEIGDVQNWAEMIERDLLVLESMMDEVEGEMDLDGSEDGHGDRNGNAGEVEVEMNGNGNANGNGVPNGNEVHAKKEKRRSWFSWW